MHTQQLHKNKDFCSSTMCRNSNTLDNNQPPTNLCHSTSVCHSSSETFKWHVTTRVKAYPQSVEVGQATELISYCH